eukprot:s1004_g32.t1
MATVSICHEAQHTQHNTARRDDPAFRVVQGGRLQPRVHVLAEVTAKWRDPVFKCPRAESSKARATWTSRPSGMRKRR